MKFIKNLFKRYIDLNIFKKQLSEHGYTFQQRKPIIKLFNDVYRMCKHKKFVVTHHTSMKRNEDTKQFEPNKFLTFNIHIKCCTTLKMIIDINNDKFFVKYKIFNDQKEMYKGEGIFVEMLDLIKEQIKKSAC